MPSLFRRLQPQDKLEIRIQKTAQLSLITCESNIGQPLLETLHTHLANRLYTHFIILCDTPWTPGPLTCPQRERGHTDLHTLTSYTSLTHGGKATKHWLVTLDASIDQL